MPHYHLPKFIEVPAIDVDATKLKLLELRKKNNLNRYELGKILLVSYQSIANWENINCQKLPDIEKIIKLSRLYNCEIEDILIIKKSKIINELSHVSEPESQYHYDNLSYLLPTYNHLEKKNPQPTTRFEDFIGKKACSNGVPLNGRYIIDEHLFNFVDGYISDKYVDGKLQSYGICSLTKKYKEHWEKGQPVSE